MSEQETESAPEVDEPEQVDEADVQEIEQQREERLDPGNRPDGAEVDNTTREFDVEKGLYTDSADYDEAPRQFPAAGEQDA